VRKLAEGPDKLARCGWLWPRGFAGTWSGFMVGVGLGHLDGQNVILNSGRVLLSIGCSYNLGLRSSVDLDDSFVENLVAFVVQESHEGVSDQLLPLWFVPS